MRSAGSRGCRREAERRVLCASRRGRAAWVAGRACGPRHPLAWLKYVPFLVCLVHHGRKSTSHPESFRSPFIEVHVCNIHSRQTSRFQSTVTRSHVPKPTPGGRVRQRQLRPVHPPGPPGDTRVAVTTQPAAGAGPPGGHGGLWHVTCKSDECKYSL